MDADRIADQGNREDANVQAFLATIRRCEGTNGPNAYHMLFGGTLFDSFAAHPNLRLQFRQTDGTLNYTTAAGAYQIIKPTWGRLQAKLSLPDFSPASQDKAAVELIAEQGAMPAVKEGDLQEAIDRCSPIWASLPSSKYPQPKRTLLFAAEAFVTAGGVLA